MPVSCEPRSHVISWRGKRLGHVTRVNVTLEILYFLNRKLFTQYNEILCTLFESEQKVR